MTLVRPQMTGVNSRLKHSSVDIVSAMRLPELCAV